jgi:hypothetical protein
VNVLGRQILYVGYRFSVDRSSNALQDSSVGQTGVLDVSRACFPAVILCGKVRG